MITASALLLPLTVLAADDDDDDDAWLLLFGVVGVIVEGTDVFSTTFRTTSGFFATVDGVTTVVLVPDAVDFTDAIDGDRFATAGLNFSESGVPPITEDVEGGRFVFAVAVVEAIEDAVDGTLGLEIVIFPIEGPWVLLLLFDIVDAVDVRRPPPLPLVERWKSEWALLNVVDASLVVDRDDVGRAAPFPGGRRLAPALDFRDVGVLERTEGLTE